MKAIYDLPAPAKLNLFLHITGQRDDGYHLLQSVFMLIDWCDTLHVELRRDGQLSREDLTTPLPADDLVLRAARALQALAPAGTGAHIGVAKSVPAQAGMGGGSSDAATCLLALNRLWGLKLPLAKLEEIGLALGADVPFFLRRPKCVGGRHRRSHHANRTSCGRCGGGEADKGLDTKSIFLAPDLERATKPATIYGFAACSAQDTEQTFGFGRNDLQPVAQRLCPAVTQAIEWLGTKGLKARMTGSGSAVFAPLYGPIRAPIHAAKWHEANWSDAPRKAGQFVNAAICRSIPW
jgi:4-diphosphocytidyl-2-C-methyl-D-erythritol kinase